MNVIGSLRTVLVAALACVLAVVAPSLASAQQQAAPTVKGVLDRSRIAVGDTALLIITVDGAEADSTPVPPGVPGLSINFFDSQRFNQFQSSYVNGKQTSHTSVTVQYRYRVEALRSGSHEIPPIPVTVGGRVTNTQPLTLVAAEPQANPDYFVELEVTPAKAYVGEPVRLRATWYVSGPVDQISFNLPGTDKLKISDAPDPRPSGTRADDPNYRPVRYLGGPVYPIVADNIEYKGRRFAAVTLDRVITAGEPGTYTLGPLRIAFDASEDRRGADVGRVFAGRPQRIVIQSNPVTLDVLALPSQGRPPGFDGLVGEYSIASGASPRSVRAGDPIDLTWKITGSITASTVPPMVLTSQRELADKFRVPVEPVVPRVMGKDAVFGASVRARPGATRIPGLALSVFDTKLKQYRVVRSEPIELEVLPGGMVSGDEPAPTTGDVPAGGGGGVAHPIRDEAAAVDGEAIVRDRIALGVALAPPGVASLLIAGVLTRRRLAADPVAQSRRAGRRAVRGLRGINLARPDAPDRAAGVLREFEGRMLRVVGVVGDEPPPPALGEIAGRIDRLDRKRFAGRPVVIDRRDIDELTAAVRAAAAPPPAPEASAARVAPRLGLWLLVGAMLALPVSVRAADTTGALDSLRTAESLAASDPVQAKALAATAIDELVPLVTGPQGRAAPLHLALARAYGVTGDVGRRQLALRRGTRLAPWNSLAPGAEEESASLAAGQPTPLAWAGYVRAVDAPIRLWSLGGAWALLWGAIVVRVIAGGAKEWGERANRLIAGAAIATVLAAVLVGFDAVQTRAQGDEAVILKPVTARTGPDDVVFGASGSALGAGTLVHVDGEGGTEPGWVRIRVGEGDAAGEPVWVRAGTLERVVPEKANERGR